MSYYGMVTVQWACLVFTSFTCQALDHEKKVFVKTSKSFSDTLKKFFKDSRFVTPMISWCPWLCSCVAIARNYVCSSCNHYLYCVRLCHLCHAGGCCEF